MNCTKPTLDNLRQWVDVLAKSTGLDVAVKESGEPGEVNITWNDSNWLSAHETTETVERRTLTKTLLVSADVLELFVWRVIPSTRETPEDTDVLSLGMYENASQAAKAAIMTILSHNLDSTIQTEALVLDYEELEELYA